MLPIGSVDGGPPSPIAGAFSLSAAGAITDNLKDSGLTDVTSGLLGDLTVSGDGTVGFLKPYSFTVTVPGMASV